MGRTPTSLSLVLVLILSLVLVAPAQAQTPNAWTVLVYLDAEGNLEESGVDNMLEMEGVGAGPNTRVLVQMDRGEDYDDRDGDWQGTRRYEIPAAASTSGDTTKLASRMIEDLGESNMGDPKTLADFLVWGVTTAPAQHYIVILWDHGGAWDGLAWDHTPEEDHLTLTELRSALEDGRQRANVPQWDIVYFDACVMGSLEVAHAVGQSAQIVIASEELVPGAGGSYRALMEAVKETPSVSAPELAGRLVKAFASRYAGAKGTGADGHACKNGCGLRAFGTDYAAYNDDAAVLSWYTMSKEPALWDAWAALNVKIKDNAGADWPTLVKAARASDRFSYADAKSPDAMDVGDFASRVRDVATDPSLRDAAASVVTAVNDLVGGYSTSPSHRGATGIMVKFPVPGGGAAKPTGTDVYTSDPEYAAAGAAFNAIATAASEGDSEGPTFGDIVVTQTATGVKVTVVVNDPNAFVVDVAISDEESEHGEVLAWISPISIEETEEGILATFEWDGTVLELVGAPMEDGQPVIAPAFRESLEAEEYILEGSYRVGPNGKEQEAFLRFDREGNLLSAWVVADGASQVRPRAGDFFAPVFMGWDAEGEPIDLMDVWVPAAGDGAKAWTLASIPLSGGTTGFSAYAEDLAGNGAMSEPFTIELPDPTEDGDTTEPVTQPTVIATPSSAVSPTTKPGDAAGAIVDVGDDTSTPGAPLAVALVLIGALALARRRRA